MVFCHSIVHDIYYCMDENEPQFCIAYYWYHDNVNNKIVFSRNENETTRMNLVLKKIYEKFSYGSCWMNIFSREGKIFIFSNYFEHDSYLFEIRDNDYSIKQRFVFEHEDNLYCSDGMIINKCTKSTKIYDGANEFVLPFHVHNRICKINKNIMYFVDDDEYLRLYYIANTQIINYRKVNLTQYDIGTLYNNIKEKIYIPFRKDSQSCLLIYDTKTQEFEFQNYEWMTFMLKWRDVLVNCDNCITFCYEYDIISRKDNNIKTINLYDTCFKFV